MRLIDADGLRIVKCNPYVFRNKGYADGWNAAMDSAMSVFKNAPTIDAEPVRHGEWFGTVCSACGESVSFNFDCNYCPRCGAKMDGESEVQE